MAWASMAVPTWFRIWLRVNLTISAAMSVSRIRLSEAERFSVDDAEVGDAWTRSRFCVAPSSPRGRHRLDRRCRST